jgi:hypothetical protein
MDGGNVGTYVAGIVAVVTVICDTIKVWIKRKKKKDDNRS